MKRILLIPLMVVAGDHAANDIAGEDHSFRQIFESAGYEVVPVMKGLGEYEKIQRIYEEHLNHAN